MAGINATAKEWLSSTKDAAINEALGKIPGYNTLATFVRKHQSKLRLRGPRTAANTVDEFEYKSAKRKIELEIGGTWNPFKWILGLFKSLFGNTKDERIVTAIKDLAGYGGLYDGFRFVNDAVDFLTVEINRRARTTEGITSKTFGTKNADLEQDPVLIALKDALRAWLEPYRRIINGQVSEIAKLPQGDIRLIESVKDRILNGSASKYCRDLVPELQQLLAEAKKAQYRPPTSQAGRRKMGQQLAQTSA